MITILKQPDTYTPSNNPIVWQLGTNNPSTVYYEVNVLDGETDAVISQLKAHIIYQLGNGTIVNLTQILKNVVKWELVNDNQLLVTPIIRVIKSYKLQITEKLFNTATYQYYDGNSITTNKCYVFNAGLGRIAFNDYMQIKYLITTSSVASFLTSQPNHKKVNDLSFENLYFVQNGTVTGLRVRVRTFGFNNQVINTYSQLVNQAEEYHIFRINASPKSLIESLNIDFSDVKYYVIDLVDSLFTPKSEERVYQYSEADCTKEYVNVLWVNNFGGIDSYQFVAPSDSISVSKFTLKNNTYNIAAGEYGDVHNGIYNPTETIINVDITTTTKVYSEDLTDKESYWISSLIYTKQAFVELPDGGLVPIMINNNSFTIPKVRYKPNELNIVNFDFTLAKGVIPAGVQAYSQRRTNIDFIDSQMNTVDNNLPGYQIIVNPSGQYSKADYTQNYS